MTVSYSINGKPIDKEKLREIQITKKDYIDYIESIKNNVNISTNDKCAWCVLKILFIYCIIGDEKSSPIIYF